jgi:hypothetical protein
LKVRRRRNWLRMEWMGVGFQGRGFSQVSTMGVLVGVLDSNGLAKYTPMIALAPS